MKRVRLSRLAKADIDDIWLHVARNDEDAATGLVRKLLEKCQSLRQSPDRGSPCPELAAGLRRLAVGNYLIFYRVTESGADVARVLHGARDLMKLFQDE